MDAIQRASFLNFQKKKNEKELRRTLHALVIAEGAKPGEFAQEIRKIKRQLEVIDAERYRGAAVRVRTDRLWLSEAPTKPALSDEKRHAHRMEIRQIQYQNKVTQDKKTIERAFVEHYRDLLGKTVPMGAGFESEFLALMPRLEQDVRDSLEAPISGVRDLEKAISELSSGKAPRPDGLGADFYKTFKAKAAHALYALLSEAYIKHILPPFFLRTHIVLIPKSDDSVKLLSVGLSDRSRLQMSAIESS